MKTPCVLPLVLSGILFLPLLSAEDNLKYGQPDCGGRVLDKKFFVICHDSSRKIPVWVGYALSKSDLGGEAERASLQFRADPDLPKGERAETVDYKNTARSRYDKGHMAPAADFKRSGEAMKSTFILSNAVPQKHGVNAGQWRNLENAVRGLADSRGSVWVFSGPVFAGKKPIRYIGPDKVAVPTHTFKVILCVHPNGEKEMFAFIMPNIDKPRGTVTDYAFTVSKVEEITGLDFFSKLPAGEQKRLEALATKLPGE